MIKRWYIAKKDFRCTGLIEKGKCFQIDYSNSIKHITIHNHIYEFMDYEIEELINNSELLTEDEAMIAEIIL